MFFVILGSLGIGVGILSIILCCRDDCAEEVGAGVFVIVLSVLPLVLPIISGIEVYPLLTSERTQVKALVESTKDIKDTYIPNIKSGSLVGGSLDNMKQANKIFEYVSMCAKSRAAVNAKIALVQEQMKISLYWWFSNTAFIDKRVNVLEKIKE